MKRLDWFCLNLTLIVAAILFMFVDFVALEHQRDIQCPAPIKETYQKVPDLQA